MLSPFPLPPSLPAHRSPLDLFVQYTSSISETILDKPWSSFFLIYYLCVCVCVVFFFKLSLLFFFFASPPPPPSNHRHLFMYVYREAPSTTGDLRLSVRAQCTRVTLDNHFMLIASQSPAEAFVFFFLLLSLLFEISKSLSLVFSCH